MATKPEALWLALHLPCLPLEALAPLSSPSAVTEGGRILLGDATAQAAGVDGGMSMAAARALAPTIALLPRQPTRETAALQMLACWAGGYTPRVHLTEDALLLEIGSCLRLFGGLERLVGATQEGIVAQGYGVTLAVAPTPLGAHWLARAGGVGNETRKQNSTLLVPSPKAWGEGQGEGAVPPRVRHSFPLPQPLPPLRVAPPCGLLPANKTGEGSEATVHPPWGLCRDMTELRAQLESLPLGILPERAAAALHRFGARTLGDVRRLPSAALGRRIGAETMQLLARAFGDLPDPRADFVFPERFAESLELPAAVENAPALLFAARRLTAALAGWLAARQAGVRGFALYLQHGRTRHHASAESELPLQFAEPTAAAERFERVLRERLERLQLAAPVTALRLEAREVGTRPRQNCDLFDDRNAGQEPVGALLERLCARLGEGRVYRVATHDDHRPECATRHVPLLGKHASAAALPQAERPPRPLWLLDPTEALAEIDGGPWRQGRLTLLAGPERIESGWWDGGEGTMTGDVRRDYFIALSADQRWLWIYRECRASGGWFLHGVFA